MHKKKLLFITTVNNKFNNGGAMYTTSILNAIPEDFVIKVLVLSEVQKYNNRIFRWLLSIIKSLHTFVPPDVLFHSGLLSPKKILSIINGPWDLIVIDRLQSTFSLNYLKHCNYIYISQNRESQLVKSKLPSLLKWLSFLLISWVDKFEISIAKSALGIVSISKIEAKWYRKYCKNVEVIYPVFDSGSMDLYKKSLIHHNELRIGFIGSGRFPPNAEAANILIKDILPFVRRDINFFLAGSGWSDQLINFARENFSTYKNIKFTPLGYVSDVNAFWADIDLFLAPIISGAGVNVKVCEALANQIPVIAFGHALRGIPDNITRSDLVYMADNNSDFIEFIDGYNFSPANSLEFKEFSNEYAKENIRNLIYKIFI